jgi:hypothetical protein
MLMVTAATTPRSQRCCTATDAFSCASQSLRERPPISSTTTATTPVAAAYRVGADGLRKATMAPPQKNAAATMQPAMIHKWVDSSIIGRPCQSSSMIIVGTETARTSSADPTMSAQPGDRGGRMRQKDRSGTWLVRGSRGPGRHLGPVADKGGIESVPGHVPPRLVTDVER